MSTEQRAAREPRRSPAAVSLSRRQRRQRAAAVAVKAVRYDEFGGLDVLLVEEASAGIGGLIADGHLDVPIANVYPPAQVREAYTEPERRHTYGKIVLRP